MAENTQAVDPVQKPQEIQTGREQDLQKDVSNGRIQLWKSGIEIWKTSPVYGTGYSTVVDYAKENVKGTYIIENSQGDYHNLHNQLINVLVYQGSIGAILLVGMFLYFCRYIWKAFQKIRDKKLRRDAVMFHFDDIDRNDVFTGRVLYQFAGSMLYSGYLADI